MNAPVWLFGATVLIPGLIMVIVSVVILLRGPR